MPDGLFEHDALAWSERQADLLRRLAAGERLNEVVDWPNVIDEVEAVGRSELRSCESLLRQAMVHLLKLTAWPGSRAAAHWQGETIGFLADARRCLSPSMRHRIDLADLYATALRQVHALADDAGEQRPLPEVCPFVFDGLLDADADVQTLVNRI